MERQISVLHLLIAGIVSTRSMPQSTFILNHEITKFFTSQTPLTKMYRFFPLLEVDHYIGVFLVKTWILFIEELSSFHLVTFIAYDI